MANRDFAEDLPDAPIHDRLGIVIQTATADEVSGTMPVKGNEQPFGALHGGASLVLAESLGSIGTSLQAGPDATVAGVDINATHHRPATHGLVRATAKPLHRGKRVATWEVVVTDEDGQRTCTARITCHITPA